MKRLVLALLAVVAIGGVVGCSGDAPMPDAETKRTDNPTDRPPSDIAAQEAKE